MIHIIKWLDQFSSYICSDNDLGAKDEGLGEYGGRKIIISEVSSSSLHHMVSENKVNLEYLLSRFIWIKRCFVICNFSDFGAFLFQKPNKDDFYFALFWLLLRFILNMICDIDWTGRWRFNCYYYYYCSVDRERVYPFFFNEHCLDTITNQCFVCLWIFFTS